MNGSALIVMGVAMIFVWGGLILSIIHLIKNPDIPLERVPDEY